MQRLNLGCGKDIKSGWINLDIAPLSGVNVVHDIQKLPLPFDDGVFDEILCRDVLEHIDYIPLMRDLWRILKDGGILEIQVPHFTSVNNYIDPTHKKLFSFKTFEFFVQNHKRSYYFDFSFKKILSVKILFRNTNFCRLVSHFVNATYRRKKLYEETFLSRLVPAKNISVKLMK